jgi:uncharacterized protein HemY
VTLNKRRAIAQLEQARLTLDRGEWAQVEALVRPVLEAGFDELGAYSLLGESLRQQGRLDDARQTLEAGLKKYPGAAELEARVACVLLDQDEPRASSSCVRRRSSRVTRSSSPRTRRRCCASARQSRPRRSSRGRCWSVRAPMRAWCWRR